MFGFLKRKKLNPIFGALGVDVHSHLIPCVDDGSKGMDETLQCLRTMQDLGFKKTYITPHFQYPRFPNEESDIQHRFEEVKSAVQEQGLEIELAGVGGEYRVDDGFAKRIEDARFLTIGDNYLLLELSLHQPRLGFEDVVLDLMDKGYEVVLAHPERYPYFGPRSSQVERMKENGLLFQVNILSLNGFYGDHAKRKAFSYLERNWVEFLGTDLHNMSYAQAMIEASNNRKIQKVLETKRFLNSKMETKI